MAKGDATPGQIRDWYPHGVSGAAGYEAAPGYRVLFKYYDYPNGRRKSDPEGAVHIVRPFKLYGARSRLIEIEQGDRGQLIKWTVAHGFMRRREVGHPPLACFRCWNMHKVFTPSAKGLRVAMLDGSPDVETDKAGVEAAVTKRVCLTCAERLMAELGYEPKAARKKPASKPRSSTPSSEALPMHVIRDFWRKHEDAYGPANPKGRIPRKIVEAWKATQEVKAAA